MDGMWLCLRTVLTGRTEVERAGSKALMHRDKDQDLHRSLEHHHMHVMRDGFHSARGLSKSPACVHLRIRKLQSWPSWKTQGIEAELENSGILVSILIA